MVVKSSGFARYWDCLTIGDMDYKGQSDAYDIQFYLIVAGGIIGFLHGFLAQKFRFTFYWVFGSFVLSLIICLPSWPQFNSNPPNWLPARGDPEDTDESESESDEDEKHAKQIEMSKLKKKKK